MRNIISPLDGIRSPFGRGGASTIALSLFFATATAASGTVTDVDGTGDVLTFTRASTATYWDADGVLQTASSGIARVGATNRKPVTNLITYPEQFDNAAWTNSNTEESGSQTDPLGGTNAFKLVEFDSAAGSTHYIEATTGIAVQAKVYTHSVYAKAGERTWLRLGFGTAAGVGFFNLTTGEVGTTSGLDGYGIAPVEGQLAESDNDVAYDGDGSSGLYLFGAMVNENGIEDYAGGTNLVAPYDKTFAAQWPGSFCTVTDNVLNAPDGTQTAMHLVEDSSINKVHAALLNVGLVSVEANTAYNASFFFKADGRTVCTFRFDGGSGYFSSGAAVYFDTVSGTVTQNSGGFQTSMTYYGDGWWRCEAIGQHDAAVSIRLTLGVADSTTGSSPGDFYTGDGSSGGYFWGVQLTKGSTLYPYVGMPQTGFVKAGYTAEAAATNLVTESEAFDAAFWTKANATITANAAVAPDGFSTADILGDNGATGTGEVRATRAVTVANSTTYTYSVFAKAAQLNWLKFRMVNFTTPVDSQAHFNVAAGVLGTVDAGLDDAGIIPCGNGWYRCWASFTTDATDTSGSIYNVVVAADGGFVVDLDGTSDIYIWGAQFETGVYPSSYIATSGGTATRAVDFLESDPPYWIKDSAGTFVVRYDRPAGMANYPQVFDASNSASSSTNRVDAYFNAGGSVTGRSTGANIPTAASPANAFAKFASAYALDNCNVAINGTVSVADTSAALPSGLNQLSIGVGDNGSTEPFGGYIKSLQYYNVRKSDADLSTLTTITDDGTAWVDEQMAP
jgi:hypothetical protein